MSGTRVVAVLILLVQMTCFVSSTDAAEQGEQIGPLLKTDIEFAQIGDVSLTLDAFVPKGHGPLPTCILVHGGGFMRGDKQSYIKPLFEPLSKAGFVWFTINYRLAPQHRWPACAEDVDAAIRWVKRAREAVQCRYEPDRADRRVCWRASRVLCWSSAQDDTRRGGRPVLRATRSRVPGEAPQHARRVDDRTLGVD